MGTRPPRLAPHFAASIRRKYRQYEDDIPLKLTKPYRWSFVMTNPRYPSFSFVDIRSGTPRVAFPTRGRQHAGGGSVAGAAQMAGVPVHIILGLIALGSAAMRPTCGLRELRMMCREHWWESRI
jgi:hypothetical protein